MKQITAYVLIIFSILINFSSARAASFYAQSKVFSDGVPTWVLNNKTIMDEYLVTVTASLEWGNVEYGYKNSNQAICTLSGVQGVSKIKVPVSWNYGTFHSSSPTWPTVGLATVTFVAYGPQLYPGSRISLYCTIGDTLRTYPKSATASLSGVSSYPTALQ